MLALDTETYFAPGYSVRDMGYYAYTHDPRFECSLVAVCDGKTSSACPPERFDWSRVEGQTLIAHNAVFDRAVFDRLQELGIVPRHIRPKDWFCTSAMSAYLNCPRDLAGAAKALLGIEVSKAARKAMSGHHHSQSLFPDAFIQYARTDAEVCFQLWDRFNKYWPEHERRLWQLTVEIGRYGIALDTAKLDQSITALNATLASIPLTLPWHVQAAPTSTKALESACSAIGIPPPPSTKQDDPALEDWIQTHISTPAPLWVRHMQAYRKTNRTKCLLESMRQRLMPGGRMESHLMYFGAITGRWSGGGNGLNLQNLNQKEAGGVDLRGLLVPAPGCRFLIVDYAQIEARILLWLVQDEKTLDAIRSGVSVYEAHARATMSWRGGVLKKENPGLYKLAKARVLGLGYGCGPEKFIVVARVMAGLDIPFDESQRIVREYRKTNRLIVDLWRRLEDAFRKYDGKTYQLPLPSKRRLLYRNVNAFAMTAEQIKGEPSDVYGGLLCENFVQAIARDIFADGLLRLVDAGFKPVLLVHDEYVIEAPAASADADLRKIIEIVTTPPVWAAGLPLEAEGSIETHYRK